MKLSKTIVSEIKHMLTDDANMSTVNIY